MSKTVQSSRQLVTVAIAGNPNCGKTSIFNALAGTHRHVGNYPGVTVEKRSSRVNWESREIELIDLPGTYSLSALTLDEKVARDFIIKERPDVVLNVIDAGNLDRNLYMTTQLLEMGVDLVVVLNMWDEAEKEGLEIDTEKLAEMLGAPVVKTIGHRKVGIGRLVLATLDLLGNRQRKHHHPVVTYGHAIDDRITDLTQMISANQCNGLPPRWYAVSLLEGSINAANHQCLTGERREDISEGLKEAQEHVRKTTNIDTATIIQEGRYGYVHGLLASVTSQGFGDRMAVSRRIDDLLTHRYFGIPIFLALMWLLFQATFSLGQYPANWLDTGVGLLSGLLTAYLPLGPVTSLLTDGVIGGVGSVLVFLPNILILFLGIAVLEDSGYLSRAAFIMDRLMRMIGLQGKAFIPMLMGFGCNVPAVMATRTLESNRERVLTVLLIPFMSCSARLPVYVLFASAFFARNAGNMIFLIYIIGVIIAVLLGRVFKMVLFRGEQLPFVMELPPYRIPTANAALIHMWERGKVYLRKMGGVILVASVILWVLSSYPKAGEDSQSGAPQQTAIAQTRATSEQMRNSYVGRLGVVLAPMITPLGFNWQMGVSLLTGFFAKEIVVSSMGVLYQVGEESPEHSGGLIEALRDPKNGITPLAAFCYMLFVLLYTPCISVLTAIRKEIGTRWALVSVALQLGVAWIVAFLTYQIGVLAGLG